MKIKLEQVDFVEPIELGTRSDGAKLYLLGYSQQFDSQPVVALEPNREANLSLLAQFMKFSQPDDWKWDEKGGQTNQAT